MRHIIAAAALIAAIAIALGPGRALWQLFNPPLQPLPLPTTLIALDSPEGQRALAASAPHPDYDALARTFQPQQHGSFCGVASSAAVLNALQTKELTQDAVFTPAVEQDLPALQVTFGGMTLDQLAGLLQAHGAHVETLRGDAVTDEQLRHHLAANLARPGDYVLVNYHRPALNQEGGGHISPVAAYDPTNERVLVLDTASYKYPQTWVPLADLRAAADTIDGSSGLSRGFLLVSAP